MNRAALYRMLRAQLPNTIGVAVRDPRKPRPGQLYPIEAAAMTRAVPRRVNEFTAGRVAARRAMTMVGYDPVAIPMGNDRAPVWPEGIVGSISHCESCCVAVVARAGDIGGIGIDVEEDTPLDRDLWEEVCRPEELAWLMTLPEDRRGREAKRIFCIKEAAYKTVYPRERRMLKFGDVFIETDRQIPACAQAPCTVTSARTGTETGTLRQVINATQTTGAGLLLSLTISDI